MGNLFYKDADAALVCFDLTNRDSFDQVTVWLKDLEAKANNPNLVCLLVGTKLDIAANTMPQGQG